MWQPSVGPISTHHGSPTCIIHIQYLLSYIIGQTIDFLWVGYYPHELYTQLNKLYYKFFNFEHVYIFIHVFSNVVIINIPFARAININEVEACKDTYNRDKQTLQIYQQTTVLSCLVPVIL